tara:strand:- start:147 stop:623 length:477 start_codon:yes stop_codon:yes gene_type:complete
VNLTKSKLKQIIKEELEKANSINEAWFDDDDDDFPEEDDPLEQESGFLQDELYRGMKRIATLHLETEYERLEKEMLTTLRDRVNEGGYLHWDDVEQLISDTIDELKRLQGQEVVKAFQHDFKIERLINDAIMAYVKVGGRSAGSDLPVESEPKESREV